MTPRPERRETQFADYRQSAAMASKRMGGVDHFVKLELAVDTSAVVPQILAVAA